MQLWATVGRFRCRNSLCPRKVFCERLPRVARAYGRQTERASEIVRLIGYVAGGVPGFGDSSLDYPLPPAMTRFCGAFGKRRCGNCRAAPFGTWVSMIGLGAKVRSMERFLSMWNSAKLSTSSLTGPPTVSRNGFDTIPKS